MKWRIISSMILLLGIISCGCEQDALEPVASSKSLLVTVSLEPLTFSEGEATEITVVVENPTIARLYYTYTSLCTLDAAIHISDEYLPIPRNQICFAEAGKRWLEPGERVEEIWIWDGYIEIDGQRVVLTKGTYEVLGFAGTIRGNPITIEVVD